MAKARKTQIDFSGVDKEIKKGGGSGTRVPEGDYLVKLVDVSLEEGPKANYFKWKTQIVKPEKYKGKTIYTNTTLKRDALWNLRNLIHAALGKNVAGKSVSFDPNTILTKVVGAAVVDGDEYKGKIKSEIQTFMPKDEVKFDSDDDEDEEPETEEEEDEDLEEVEVEDL